MRNKLYLLAALFLFGVGPAFADAVTYQVTVNTSSIAGTSGSLDFEFNPGSLTSQSATLQVLGFTSNGTLGAASLTGNVSGALPGSVTFNNTTVLNDYFQGFTYGNSLSFDVSLSGPALTAPNGTAAAGSAFAFSMFSDPAGTVPALTTDAINGFAYTIAVNLDGTTTPTNFSPELTAGVAVPEIDPSSGLSALTLLAGAVMIIRARRQKQDFSS